MMEETSSSVGHISEPDIRLFKTTLLARRFPGLQKLSEKEIVDLIIADQKAAGRKLESTVKSYPKTHFKAPTPKKELWFSSSQPVFTCINPSQAKDDIKRPENQSYLGVNTPYSADHMDLMEDIIHDESKRRTGPFLPTSTTQARGTICIDYYLNSSDAAAKEAELSATRRKAAEQMHHYIQQQTARRGHMLVQSPTSS
ncbi:hypothetical protein CEUSTIGMA_g4772.t1 [Chlamydomonas eustigma]|uniref:Uncharacterized protein n=1 Tax=Chlamydomonas eustigma TaxID=1157962 RepID=A0A250X2P7_9CHLO|nr:hypothetical protein CEUSTIGMA_g4772.t1 [Chlamydomonas eustigma]|eukprot:GAX77326.1 hypothetical protein CEUSTIGMA_g4772.t1 [Chlamydomonas eustigma]